MRQSITLHSSNFEPLMSALGHKRTSERSAECPLYHRKQTFSAILLDCCARAAPAESQCPLLGVKRTLIGRAPMSAFDPKRTSVSAQPCRQPLRPCCVVGQRIIVSDLWNFSSNCGIVPSSPGSENDTEISGAWRLRDRLRYVTLLLSALAAWYFFLPPYNTFAIGTDSASCACHVRHRQRRRDHSRRLVTRRD